jgi:hypothetical protein
MRGCGVSDAGAGRETAFADGRAGPTEVDTGSAATQRKASRAKAVCDGRRLPVCAAGRTIRSPHLFVVSA